MVFRVGLLRFSSKKQKQTNKQTKLFEVFFARTELSALAVFDCLVLVGQKGERHL